jgi:hypothetical protein
MVRRDRDENDNDDDVEEPVLLLLPLLSGLSISIPNTLIFFFADALHRYISNLYFYKPSFYYYEDMLVTT